MYKIFDGANNETKYLKLERLSDGIRLICCDVNGKSICSILSITDEGSLILHSRISGAFSGLLLSEDGTALPKTNCVDGAVKSIDRCVHVNVKIYDLADAERRAFAILNECVKIRKDMK